MTIQEALDEIKARADKATPGPWHLTTTYAMGEAWENIIGNGKQLFEMRDLSHRDDINKDAIFCSHARTDIPRLLSALQKAIEQRNHWLSDSFYGEDGSLMHGRIKDEDAEIEAILKGEK